MKVSGNYAFPNGTEVTDGTRRGVVTDGWIKLGGRGKGKIEVMWIGARWITFDDPINLKSVSVQTKKPSAAATAEGNETNTNPAKGIERN